ncbi:MAG: SpoIID/LytB domain-containing protein [Clostridia bacterium]
MIQFFKKFTISMALAFGVFNMNAFASEYTMLAFDNYHEVSNPVVKIGFLYGSTAVATTNLDNYTGSGHSLGYFTSEYHFINVFDTSYEAISILKNKNIYLGSDSLYYDTKLSNTQGTIGGHSIELSTTFANRDEAEYTAYSISGAFPAYIDGEYKVRVNTYTSLSEAQSALSGVQALTGDSSAYVVTERTDLYTVTNTKTAKVLFQFANNGQNFGVLPNGDITWTKGYRYYGGFEYSRQSGDNITVVNIVTMQDYLKGVVPYEMSGSWNVEALKAQALCARSYAYNNTSKHSRYGFDLCNSTDCQVYYGTSGATTNSDTAVNETYAEYIDYKGEIATGYYYSSNGGALEASQNVWSSAVPYLVAKYDPYERSDEVYMGVWETTITNAQIAKILQLKGYSEITGVSNMYIKEYTDVGNVATLTVVATNGKSYDFSKETARTILNSTTYGTYANSIRFRINEVMPSNTPSGEVYVNDEKNSTLGDYYIKGSNGTSQVADLSGMTVLTADGTNELVAYEEQETVLIPHASGEYVISGRGWGHNVGMSQYGAKHMADAGYTYKEIIEFYFDGTTVVSKK